jgi:hypothetical protein
MTPRIEAVEWAEVGDTAPRSRLLAQINILGCAMHLEAYEVELDPETGEYAVLDLASAASVTDIHAAVGGDGPWTTATIRGRQYVLVATPYCD